ncbi:MAG: FAD:protein FMN transferase [Deltaproteobacteria bacterium]|nr:MAG: FAD:protein FMN transferase [Deltaproteobacteria bacterium]
MKILKQFFPEISFLLFFFIPSLAFSSTFQRTQVLMGDVPVSITLKTSQKQKAYHAMESAFQEVNRLNKTVSEWQPKSDATRLNQHPLVWVPIGKDLMTILLKAHEISEMTHGAFDVTWASKNQKISYQDVELIPELGLARLSQKKMMIGVSSIAKGYIIDRMVLILRKQGFRNFLINAGDIYAAGTWKVFIKCPDAHPGPCANPITLHNQAISTSGLYERGAHIVDPRIGKRKTPYSWWSTTVIANHSFIASPLATALFVMDPQEANSFLHERQDVRGYLFMK